MIDHVDYHITDHCNFKCKGCNQFGPLAKEWCISYEQFCEEWQFVHDKGLKFNELRILGGETLLHPELNKLMIFLRGLYPTCSIVVYTNGILLPQRREELLPVFNQYHIRLFISVYPNMKLDYRKLVEGFELSTLMNESSFMNTCLHRNPDFDQDRAFRNCNTGSNWKCRFLYNYHLYPCSMLPNLRFLIDYYPELKNTPLGQINIEDSGIDIRTHSIDEIEAFLRSSVPACKFCNVDHAHHFRPWGITDYDIKEWVED